jgi:hypothetical protein
MALLPLHSDTKEITLLLFFPCSSLDAVPGSVHWSLIDVCDWWWWSHYGVLLPLYSFFTSPPREETFVKTKLRAEIIETIVIY